MQGCKEQEISLILLLSVFVHPTAHISVATSVKAGRTLGTTGAKFLNLSVNKSTM